MKTFEDAVAEIVEATGQSPDVAEAVLRAQLWRAAMVETADRKVHPDQRNRAGRRAAAKAARRAK